MLEFTNILSAAVSHTSRDLKRCNSCIVGGRARALFQKWMPVSLSRDYCSFCCIGTKERSPPGRYLCRFYNLPGYIADTILMALENPFTIKHVKEQAFGLIIRALGKSIFRHLSINRCLSPPCMKNSDNATVSFFYGGLIKSYESSPVQLLHSDINATWHQSRSGGDMPQGNPLFYTAQITQNGPTQNI